MVATIHINNGGDSWTLYDAIIMALVAVYLFNIVGFAVVIGLLLIVIKHK
jgi:hypothetical protein